MSKKNKPQGGGDPNQNEAFLFIGVGLILFMLWMAYHTKIAALVLGIRGAEAWVIGLFTDELLELQTWMKYVKRSTVSAGQMWDASSQVGSYIRWACFPFFLYFGYSLFKNSPTEKFLKVYTFKTLPPAVASLYPWMRISVTNDFTKMDPQKGNWAVSKSERQFARVHGLRDSNGDLDRAKATKVFINQLGQLWMGVDHLPEHAKGMFALLLVRMCKDFKRGDKLLLQLANSAADGKLDISGSDEIIAEFIDHPSFKRLLKRHAYEKTLFVSMLLAARGGDSGKDYLPPNWFLWLKGIDRGLWYALEDVGRRTYHVEAAGVYSHWLTEVARNKKLEIPFVVNAVDAFDAELRKFTFDEDDNYGLEDNGEEDLLEIHALPPAPKIPSPEEFEKEIQKKKR